MAISTSKMYCNTVSDIIKSTGDIDTLIMILTTLVIYGLCVQGAFGQSAHLTKCATHLANGI